MTVDIAAQFLNSCHLCVCTRTLPFRLERIKDLQSDGGNRSHSRQRQNSQPAILFSTERNANRPKATEVFYALSAVCEDVLSTHNRLPLARRRGHASSRTIQSQAEQRTSTLSSMTVTNKIKKHFLNESRQGVAPDRVFASQRCKNLLKPHPCPSPACNPLPCPKHRPAPRSLLPDRSCSSHRGGKAHPKPQEKRKRNLD